MDFAPMLKKVFDFFIYYCSKEFTFAGFTTTIGAFFVWCFFAGIGITILKGLAD